MYELTIDALRSDDVLGEFVPAGAQEADAAKGTLSWSDDDGARLHIVSPSKAWDADELGSIRDVQGVLADGTAVTLPEARVSGHRQAAFSSTRLQTNTMLVGAECEPACPWNKMTFRTAHLHRWLPETGISVPTHEQDRVAVEWRQPESIKLELDGAEITIGVALQTEVSFGPDQAMRSMLNVHIEPTSDLPLDAFERDYVRPLQAFSALAADRWDDVVFQAASGTHTQYPIRIFRTGRTAKLQDWHPRDGDFLFLAKHCNDVARVLRRWFELFDTAGLPIAVFGETLRNGNTYFPGRLIALVTALEGYCNATLSSGSDFFETFKILRKHAGVNEQVNRCTDENLELLWRARNYYTHLGARGGYSPAELEDALLNCCRWATSLMQSCLLRDLGFSTAEVEALLEAHYGLWPLP